MLSKGDVMDIKDLSSERPSYYRTVNYTLEF